ncbi:uncharacterized protein FA14DRAFT_162590 [Meira miltonrushii]|uniref:PHD-type domain-containing protein n=1 Tax=Meira miltonrushii TaxID=1280837 RepID=A0A316V856_9BASI|nr:uncharacterized protein FA14DRAFT_162590 [Meira miltonrushii]PWN31645.1 hypothetical protein FA14DRAFT_162590 [Meira miltonrushii]
MAPPRRAAAVSAASNLAASAPSNRSASQSTPKGSNSKENGKQSQKDAASTVPVASSSKPPAPVIPLSPIIARLRTMWKFAAICQFLFTFDEAFGFSGFESDALENDLNGTEMQVIPDLFRRLLYTLTLNRNISDENWEEHLRKQYINRDPDAPLLGTIEEPQSWHALPLQQKVDSIHTLCEWQLWDAEKFRKLVKNEEDAEVWRIDPIGWDAEDNTYWLFDDNRLWIQHPPPAPPAAPKAKAPPKKSSKKAKAEARREAQKRKREAEANASTSNIGTPAKSARSTPAKPSARLPRTPPTRSSPRSRLANGESAPKQSRSTRSSRRTGEWEEIPAELLYDGDSDLSDPPEDDTTAVEVDTTADVSMKDEGDESEAIKEEDLIEGEGETTEAEEEDPAVKDEDSTHALNGILKEEENDKTGEADVKEESVQPEVKEEEKPEWIEFEALVVTRQEWEWMSTRFAKSRHPDEKALHQLLKDTVLPKVMADMDEADKQRAHELAMANRKRSSRIALKESEREEKERDRIARQKMEDKMAAIRAEEDEKVRKEQEEIVLARTREERLREREERLLAREREAEERVQREIDEREERERLREMRKLKREQIIANGGQPPDDDQLLDAQGAGQDDDSWELDCEICGKSGINLDDTEEIVCCEQCGIWQHTHCWNAFDRKVGRSKRDWENEDFYCSKCRPPAPGQPRPQGPTFQSIPQQNASTQSSKANTPVVPSQRSPVQETFSYPSAAAYSAERSDRQQNSFPNYTTLYGNYQNNMQQPPYGYQAPQQQQQQPHYPYPSPSHPTNVPQPVRPPFSQSPPTSADQAARNVAGGAPSQVSNPVHQARPSQPVPPYQPPMQTLQGSQQMASRPLPMQAPPSNAMSAPKVPQSIAGGGQNVPAASPRPPQNPVGQNIQHAGAPSRASPTGSQTNGASAPPPPQHSPGAGKPNGSPSYGGQNAPQGYPARSPGSMNGNQPLPRNISNQPSGSFPMRHTPARSPLSGPHRESPLSMPSMSIGPPVRSVSPSPATGLNRQTQQTAQGTPLTAGRPPQLSHELLHSRQPSTGSATSASSSAQTPDSAGAKALSATSSQGPGPISGSLARPSSMQSPNRPPANLPSVPAAPPVEKINATPVQNVPASSASTGTQPIQHANGMSDQTLNKSLPSAPIPVSDRPQEAQNAPQAVSNTAAPLTTSTSNPAPQQ